jgi:hypothetical protein
MHHAKGRRAHTLRPPVNASHYNTCLDPFCVAASIGEREKENKREEGCPIDNVNRRGLASGSDSCSPWPVGAQRKRLKKKEYIILSEVGIFGNYH